MTVSSATNKSGPYTGNGVTTVFAYGFRILDASHIQVVRTENGGDTVLTTGFTVSGVGNAGGGNVTFAVAPTAAQKITLIRNAPFTQQTDLENQGAYYAEVVEQAFDLATMRDQQLQEQIDRSVKVPVGQATFDPDALISDVIRLADSADQVDAVAAIEAQVVTVAGIASDVTVVADNLADVTNFADVYQGPKAVAPSLRNDGSALLPGDLYFDTVLGGMRVRTGSNTWIAALSADALEKSQNGADIPNKAAFRTALSIFGIGSDTTTTITNLNTLAVAGEYFAASGATGSPNAEPILVKMYAADATTRAVQEVFGLTSGRRWMRVETASAWGSWVEIPGTGGITTAMLAAAAIRLSSEGFASPLDTELATALWAKGYTDQAARLTFAPAEATTSGTAFDFGSIPPGVSEVEVVARDCAFVGADSILIQLGTSGGFQTTGYSGHSYVFVAGSNAAGGSTAGIRVTEGAAGRPFTGSVRFVRTAGNSWVATISGGNPTGALAFAGGGQVALSGELTQVRVTRAGASSFNSGSVTVGYR